MVDNHTSDRIFARSSIRQDITEGIGCSANHNKDRSHTASHIFGRSLDRNCTEEVGTGLCSSHPSSEDRSSFTVASCDTHFTERILRRLVAAHEAILVVRDQRIHPGRFAHGDRQQVNSYFGRQFNLLSLWECFDGQVEVE